jgi:hypothetical protein
MKEKETMKIMKAKTLDRIFDENEKAILDCFDTKQIEKPNEEPIRIPIDFPRWMVDRLDREARHLGVSRQAIIKMWLAEKLAS